MRRKIGEREKLLRKLKSLNCHWVEIELISNGFDWELSDKRGLNGGWRWFAGALRSQSCLALPSPSLLRAALFSGISIRSQNESTQLAARFGSHEWNPNRSIEGPGWIMNSAHPRAPNERLIFQFNETTARGHRTRYRYLLYPLDDLPLISFECGCGLITSLSSMVMMFRNCCWFFISNKLASLGLGLWFKGL